MNSFPFYLPNLSDFDFDCNFYFYYFLVSPDEAMCPPDFSTRLLDTSVNDGQSLELSCKVTGDPEPQITWLKNGKVSPK